jgi:RNA polymerase sigma-70 factor (ECF subfamily)
MPATETNPSIFLRLRGEDQAPREVAWAEFQSRYGPIIAGFARRLGARSQDVEDIVQDVMLGFFATAPTFVYDPSRGRFRGYLKVCTWNALNRRVGRELRHGGLPLHQVEPEALSVEQIWSDVWEQQRLRRALAEIRAQTGPSKSFLAFEQYVIFERPADVVASELSMHINSVYRAREQITQMLQARLAVPEDD